MLKHVLAAALLTLAIFGVYEQVGGHDYLNLDDDVYVLQNPQVRAGFTWEGARWAFTQVYEAYWLPLTWLSFMIDVELWGLDAGAQVLTNVAFHGVATLLLYAMLVSTTGAAGASFFVAGCFALHPVHVESVAWVSERKDVLSSVFWMLALLSWTRFAGSRTWPAYTGALTCFALGLLTKPTLVMLPVTLLLLDYWPLERRDGWFSLLEEKIPFFALSAAASVVTVLTQSSAGAVKDLAFVSVADRLANAIAGYGRYLALTVWPHDMAIFYPYRASTAAEVLASSAVLLGLAAVVVRSVRGVRPVRYAAMGVLWFLAVLLPVIGLVQVGGQLMADRWLHVPSIGLTIALAFAARDLAAARPGLAKPLAGMGAVALVVMAAVSYKQTGYWRDSITMFEHTLAVTERNFLAHNNLGQALAAEGRQAEAGEHYAAAVEIHPGYPPARNNLGTHLAKQGRFAEAVPHFEAALAIDAGLSAAQNNLATIFLRTGHPADAVPRYEAALRLDPNNAFAHSGLGDALSMLGRPAEAERSYRRALAIDPGFAQAIRGLARTRPAR